MVIKSHVTTRTVAEQCAALCWRKVGSDIEVLLITSRDTRRWVVPKGWPMDGKTESETAAKEAWEEAGVRGHIRSVAIGEYRYWKPELNMHLHVAVFALRVDKTNKKFPEREQRKRKWLPPLIAAELVHEKDLAEIIKLLA